MVSLGLQLHFTSNNASSSLHLKFLLVTLKTLHPECFLQIVFSARIFIAQFNLFLTFHTSKMFTGSSLVNKEATILRIVFQHQKQSLNNTAVFTLLADALLYWK